MPTFLILKGTHVKETIRGANPTALRTAVLAAAERCAEMLIEADGKTEKARL